MIAEDIFQDFLADTSETLTALDADIIALEKIPSDRVRLDRVFRALHTIKGECGFLGLPRLLALSHQAESLLARHRSGEMPITAATTAALLACMDRMRGILGGIATDRREGAGDDSALLAALENPDVAGALSAVDDIQVPETQTIRVHTAALEDLMAQVSELVQARNQMLQCLKSPSCDDVISEAGLQRLNQAVAVLQGSVMQARLQPVSTAWARLPRLLHDLSIARGQEIFLDLKGGDVGLDRQMIDHIRDPLAHLLRNAVAHGIEPVAERLQAGKPPAGRIQISAMHGSGHIVLTVSDDGRGMDLGCIRRRAVESGIVAPQAAGSMGDADILQLVFSPGLTTAETPTALSGRGVGLDVVRANLERAGGSISVASRPGRGVTFMLRIPLTLAIVPALVVAAGGGRHALPLTHVREIVRAEGRIETIDGAGFLRLRNSMLPVVPLVRLMRGAEEKAEVQAEGAAGHALVVDSGQGFFAILVDRVLDTEDIVVKPLPSLLKSAGFFSGSTILGDGSVVMILDPARISRLSGVHGVLVKNELVPAAPPADLQPLLFFTPLSGTGVSAVDARRVLRIETLRDTQIESAGGTAVFQYNGRLVPLQGMTDLQEGSPHKVIILRDGEGDAPRLVGLLIHDIHDIVQADEFADGGTENSLPAPHNKAVQASRIIGGVTVDIIDANYYFEACFGQSVRRRRRPSRRPDVGKTRVLLIDDSPFFCKMIMPLLQDAGYDVTVAADAEAALDLRRAGKEFSLIVSDIEMAGMGGLALAQCLKRDGIWQGVPLLAVSAHATVHDIERGRAAGFDGYVGKFDREGLLHAIALQTGSSDASPQSNGSRV